jgi:phosphoribosyl-dephospho-CoA transferase
MRAICDARRGNPVAKDKKNKKGKKDKKGNGSVLAKAPKKAAKSLQTLSQNPLVADVVAAALVAMAAALKDSDKARRMADDAGAELNTLSKNTSKQSNAMWDLALDVGRKTLETLASETASRGKAGRSH